jgi:hypothetical protein
LRLVREVAMTYRYAPKLREEVNSLLGSVTRPIAAPTEPQKLRLREVSDETAKAIADLNAVVAKIQAINGNLSSHPHIVTGAAIK